MKAKVLVLKGDGINCERETAQAFQYFGAHTELLHVNDLIGSPDTLLDYDILALSGGFSFGDELGSGTLLALKLKLKLRKQLTQFVTERRPILGICNGFQVLVKLGLLPFAQFQEVATLTHNKANAFIDKWVMLHVNTQLCKWTQTHTTKKNKTENSFSVILPIRHGEGNFQMHHKKYLNKLKQNNQIVFSYASNPNGSLQNIAGLCDETGTILGLMPHPECFFFQAQAPKIHPDPLALGEGHFIFKNILDYISSQK